VLGDDDVEIAITHCGICGSDLHTAFGGWGDVEYPIITGHEIVGTVRQKGSRVTDFGIGDRVGVGAQCRACLGKQGTHCPGCLSGNENHCEVERVDTYNGRFTDGERSQGGYAEAIRVDKNFVFKIPENISSEQAAPLLCAGATTYSPLVRYGAGPNKRVGIVGFGGLGHLAVQFAAKLGAKEVVLVSHSKSKADIARKLGATAVIDISNEAEAKQYDSKLDIVLVTANAKGMNWEAYLRLCAFHAVFISVAIPEEPVPINVALLNIRQVSFAGSIIGSLSEIREMLNFCSQHDVRPMVELLPMSEVNEGIRRVREGDVRYRVVLHNS
jgi:alcohol dehydrogenase (NADP+)